MTKALPVARSAAAALGSRSPTNTAPSRFIRDRRWRKPPPPRTLPKRRLRPRPRSRPRTEIPGRDSSPISGGDALRPKAYRRWRWRKVWCILRAPRSQPSRGPVSFPRGASVGSPLSASKRPAKGPPQRRRPPDPGPTETAAGCPQNPCGSSKLLGRILAYATHRIHRLERDGGQRPLAAHARGEGLPRP